MSKEFMLTRLFEEGHGAYKSNSKPITVLNRNNAPKIMKTIVAPILIYWLAQFSEWLRL
jgi:hypothetical protein